MKTLRQNQLLTVILSIVTLGSMILAVLLAVAITTISNNSYIKSYTGTNKILITELKSTFDEINESAVNAFQAMENSHYVKQYFTDHSDPRENYYNLYQIKNELSDYFYLNEGIRSSLSILGSNGEYFYLGSSRTVYENNLEILKNHKDYIMSGDRHSRYIPVSTGSLHGLGIIKSVFSREDASLVGHAVLFIKEEELNDLYDSIIDSKTNHIYLLDSDGRIVSTNMASSFGHSDTKLLSYARKSFQSGDIATFDRDQNILTQKTYGSEFLLSSVIDTNQLIRNQNLMPSIAFIVILVIVLISVIMYFCITKSIRPIYKLIKVLPKVSQGNFSEKINVSGGYEVRQLANAYNNMLSDLNSYFIRLKESEAQKRRAEIHALQMQIRPHFIYNTLAVIKQLVAEFENSKAVESIEALILLLRSTIGNAKEYTLIQDEVDMLHSYISLMELRHGGNVQVHIFTDKNANDLYIPQMMIQPFIENAFFHAFPNGREGFLNIFIQTEEEKVIIQLSDNGVGFPHEALEKREDKLSGVGIRNVSDRIEGMFGGEYGVKIHSTLGEGTVVRIELPVIKNADRNS